MQTITLGWQKHPKSISTWVCGSITKELSKGLHFPIFTSRSTWVQDEVVFSRLHLPVIYFSKPLFLRHFKTQTSTKFHFLHYSLKFHHGIDVSEMASEMKNTSSDSFHKCGDFLPCYKDRDVILKMQGEAPALAVKYTLVILSCYLIGLVILWIHYVKQKYGEVGILLHVSPHPTLLYPFRHGWQCYLVSTQRGFFKKSLLSISPFFEKPMLIKSSIDYQRW